jgi:hypothetical protein
MKSEHRRSRSIVNRWGELKTPRRDGGVSTVPALEHARRILRDLGLPLTENHALVADCIQSIARAKQLDFAGASDYLIGAIRQGRAQGVPINRFYFVDGRYMEVNPVPQISPGGCRTCGGEGRLLQNSRIPGPRRIPCPDCENVTDVKRRSNARLNKAEQRKLDNLAANAKAKAILRGQLH